PDSLPNTPILLHRAGLAHDLERERQQTKLEHLLRLATLPLCRIAQVMQALAVQNDWLRKIRTDDRRIIVKNLARPLAQSMVGIHKPREYSTPRTALPQPRTCKFQGPVLHSIHMSRHSISPSLWLRTRPFSFLDGATAVFEWQPLTDHYHVSPTPQSADA